MQRWGVAACSIPKSIHPYTYSSANAKTRCNAILPKNSMQKDKQMAKK